MRRKINKEVANAILEEKEELNEMRRRRKKGKNKGTLKRFFIVMFILGTICCYVRTIFIIWTKTRI